MVIIGGGAVGVELAGEIRQKYSFKKVTLVHSHDELLSAVDANSIGNRKFAANALAILRGQDVEVLLGERVENLDELTYDQRVSQTVRTTSVRRNYSNFMCVFALCYKSAIKEKVPGTKLRSTGHCLPGTPLPTTDVYRSVR